MSLTGAATFRVKGPQRVYDFRATSSAEAAAWIQAINDAAAAAHGKGSAASGASAARGSAAEAAPDPRSGAASLSSATGVGASSGASGSNWGADPVQEPGDSSKEGGGRRTHLPRPFRAAQTQGVRTGSSAPPRTAGVQVCGTEASKASPWVDISGGGGVSTTARAPPPSASMTGSGALASGKAKCDGADEPDISDRSGGIDSMDRDERRTGASISNDL